MCPMPIKHVHELDFQCKANKAKAVLTLTSRRVDSGADVEFAAGCDRRRSSNNLDPVLEIAAAAAAVVVAAVLSLVQHFKRGCQTGFWLTASLSWTRPLRD
ncbi:hypothetical protein ACLKA7_003084 [Drosophila subpalustris]